MRLMTMTMIMVVMVYDDIDDGQCDYDEHDDDYCDYAYDDAGSVAANVMDCSGNSNGL